jgi:putative ABC transport system substrate-binding protein
VFIHPGDPVAAGILKTSGDSARNITGVAAYAAETTEKRLALFKEILPALTRIHVFFDANSSVSRNNLALAEGAAKKLAVQIVPHGVRSADALKSTLGNLNAEARQKRLPSMFNEEVWAIRGATAAYGPSYLDMGRHAGRLVDQIIKGKTPASLPIARATKFDLTINYRGATVIGLQLPKDILKRADKVIR